MSMDRKTMMLAWLRDAHAMEESLIPILEIQAKEASGHPQVVSRVKRHIEETRRHADLVRGCLERHDASPSKTRDLAGKIFGSLQAPSTAMFEDTLVKNTILDHAVENFEIAAYRALREAAGEVGDMETGRVCGEILKDEEDMANFLRDALPHAVQAAMVKGQ